MELFKLFGTIAIRNTDANDAIDDTTDKAKQSENKISSTFKKIGKAVATYFAVDKIKDFGLNCINAASDAQAASSQFSQVFGDMEKDASKSLKGIVDNTGISVNRMKGSYTQIAAFAKTTGMDTESSLGLANRAMVAVADSAAFYDRSLEETTESLQSFLKGNYENDAALGLSCTETTRNAAANKLYGKSFNDLSESQKQLTLLQMVEDANAASGALGQAARESDTWTNQTGNLKQAWTDFQAALGNNVLPLAVTVVKNMASAVQTLAEKVPGVVEHVKNFADKCKELSPIILGVATAVTVFTVALNFGTIVSTVTGVLGKLKTAVLAVNAAMSANPILLIVSLIAGLVVALITLWNTNEDFRNAVITIWEAIKNAFSTVIETIKGFFTGLVETVSSVWNTIKETISTVTETIKAVITNIFTETIDTLSTIWETIKNVVQVAIMFIVEVITTAFELITLPWRFIWENCKEYIIAAWEVIRSAVSTALDAIKTTISSVWNAIKSVISTVMNAIKTTVGSIWNSIKSTVSSVVNAIKSVISSVFNAIKSIVSSILSSIKSTFSSVWNAIKSTVSNVINGIKSTISNGLNAAKSVVSGVLEAIKSKFSSIFEGAKNIVKSAIDRIKGFFNFSWSLPHLKLPHFSVSGKFSLDPPSVPHFGIEWYKKAMDDGMIMNQPTIFGYNPKSEKLLAGGEAGSETVVGTDSLMTMIKNAVNEEDRSVSALLSQILAVLQRIDRKLYSTMVKALEEMRFEVNDREFARLVRRV